MPIGSATPLQLLTITPRKKLNKRLTKKRWKRWTKLGNSWWKQLVQKSAQKTKARQSWGKSWKDSWRQKWPEIFGVLHPSLFCQLLFVPSTFESTFFGSPQLLSQLAFEPFNFWFNFCVNLFPTFQLLRIFLKPFNLCILFSDLST